jgi:hypothetical protein
MRSARGTLAPSDGDVVTEAIRESKRAGVVDDEGLGSEARGALR